MTIFRAVVALVVICSTMVIADYTDPKEPPLSLLPENPFSGQFPDPCKSLLFPFSFPLPELINNFPPPIFSTLLPFPFSKPGFKFPPSLLTPDVPVESLPATLETLLPAGPEPLPA
ncbi:uncharacterized protein LOC114129691 [Aphis gossypii]|uniref:uncharacterized protein LOC114129691 n=1 Tax=Aphis gossypii TaxID=80765 RepID=UPI002159AF5E|nr:uncharacterized protein LOC114129691 [Aphis gossypii]